jgi:hypothetical protein
MRDTGVGNPLPITSKLLPAPRNLMYLAEVAALTRVATGIMRVLENRPSKQSDPKLSQNEKRQALMERFFVEIIGTFGYMSFLHLGQDIVNGIYGRLGKLDPKHLTDDARQILEKYKLDVDKFNKVVLDTFDTHAVPAHVPLEVRKINHKDLLARVLYGERVNGITHEKANLATLKNNFIKEYTSIGKDKRQVEAAFNAIMKKGGALTEFAKKNNRWASGGIALGVLLSAAIGGTVIQWMNDRIVAPAAKNWLSKRFKDGGPTAAQKKEADASTGQTAENVPPKPLTFLSAAPTFPTGPVGTVTTPNVGVQAVNSSQPGTLGAPQVNGQAPVFSPGYLPNPKIQSPGNGFAVNALASPYRLNSVTTVGGM